MPVGQETLLVIAVIGVGVLHTMVPDHWAPIALLARQRGWSRNETARAAFQAGSGHIVTTLLFGLAVWLVGASAAQSYGHVLDLAASLALVAFGLWIGIGAWRELHHDAHGGHGHTHLHDGDSHTHVWDDDPLYLPARGVPVAARHVHSHLHGGGRPHSHWHDHSAGTAHAVTVDEVPIHRHKHKTSGRMALLLVLGSSPMVEGIPAFFAASRYGATLVIIMSIAFAISTIATYVVLSVYSASGLQRLNLGPVERYGEVISGGFIAAIGVAFGLFSLA
jgi:ABC-type nickel/cobalt efflux system permease component RcnA